MSTGHDHRCYFLEHDSTIQVLLSPLPERQKDLALSFLADVTGDELMLLSSRLAALSIERFWKLVQFFDAKESGGLSDRRLFRYLKFMILRGWNLEIYPTQQVQSHNSPAVNEEAVAEKATVTEESFPDSKQHTTSQLARLPREIYDMIVEKLYEAVFIPGEIGPESMWFHNQHDGCSSNCPIYKIESDLISLSPDLYEEYKWRYWSENTFVFNKRFKKDHREMIYEVPDTCRKSIRSVKFVVEHGESVYEGDETYYDDKDLLDNFTMFKTTSQDIHDELLHSWYRKAFILFHINLENLIIDVSNAYSSDGEFLGMRFARTLPKFRYGVPFHFEVIAPSLTIAKGIRRVIEDLNI